MYPTLQAAEIEESFAKAARAYGRLEVDAETAITRALETPLSLHCWQADDVAGFEVKAGALDGGGIMATGNYPGRARDADELRQDLEWVLGLVPGASRVNLHASYAETGGQRVDRDALKPSHFRAWIAWAKKQEVGLDFNPTYFAHPQANDGFTLSHRNNSVRRFWVRHGIASRRIGEAMGRALGKPCVVNSWIPDGSKDSPVDRAGFRERLVQSLDEIYDPKLRIDAKLCVDAVEGKLFGLGSEDFVVGSHEFYLGYAQRKGIAPCLDMGHFHPTEGVADKLSAMLPFHKRILLHLSRPIRWDSDHIVIFNDDLRAVFQELARANALGRVFLALDYFDASVNRTAAYVIGARATRKALLYALLEPTATLQALEVSGKNALKLALLEECRTLPFGAVWDELCRRAGVPAGTGWLNEAEAYEKRQLSTRR